MRRTPDDVLRLVTGALRLHAVSEVLDAVRRDPNWCVLETSGVSMRSLQLLYGPTGTMLDIGLLRVGTSWHGRLRVRALSASTAQLLA